MKLIISIIFLFSSLSTIYAQQDGRITDDKSKPEIVPIGQDQNRSPFRRTKKSAILKVNLTLLKTIDAPQMVLINGKEFNMGAEISSGDDGPEHTVQLPGFELSETPITNKQFAQFVETTKYKTDAEREPTSFEKANNISWRTFAKDRDNYPVIWISYNDAYAYCRWLTLVLKPRGTKATVIEEDKDDNGSISGEAIEIFRLPTEAEWEYAARGSLIRMPFPQGEAVNKGEINFNLENQRSLNKEVAIKDVFKYLKPVGQTPANGFGLKDMSGNVGQWCFDYYEADFYAKSPNYLPYGPDESKTNEQVIRGGNWLSTLNECRVFSRQHAKDSDRNITTGFRVARNLPTNVHLLKEESSELNIDTRDKK